MCICNLEDDENILKPGRHFVCKTTCQKKKPLTQKVINFEKHLETYIGNNVVATKSSKYFKPSQNPEQQKLQVAHKVIHLYSTMYVKTIKGNYCIVCITKTSL